MLAQGAQRAARGAERGAGRVRPEAAPDGVVLEAVGLAAGAEVRVGRRLHGRHAGVVGVQVGVSIHLIHGVRAGRCSLQAREDKVPKQGGRELALGSEEHPLLTRCPLCGSLRSAGNDAAPLQGQRCSLGV